jgi:hypothetical protein
MATETPSPAEHAVDRILESVQYKHFVQGFERASGLELHAYSLESVPHRPVLGPDGSQLLNLVSDTARFGPVEMDGIIKRSVGLKVTPDALAAQAELVPLVSRDRSLLAGQILFVAAVPTEELPRAILDAVLEFTGAEVAYLTLLDDHRVHVAEASTLKTRAEWWRILGGVAQAVVQAEQPVEVPNTSDSAWCRHMAGSPPPPASLHGVPLIRTGSSAPSWSGESTSTGSTAGATPGRCSSTRVVTPCCYAAPGGTSTSSAWFCSTWRTTPSWSPTSGLTAPRRCSARWSS